MTGVASSRSPAPVVVAELFDDGDEVVVLEPDIWESVDVVPVALADAPFAIRSPSVRLDRGRAAVDAAARDAPARRPTRARAAADLDAARPASVEMMRRRPTPPATCSKADAARAPAGAVQGQPAARSPSDLALVGIYDRVPGGAIGSVAVDAETLVIRLAPGRRARPATLSWAA